jgi:CRP-like cAMP-binding protein
MQVSGDALRIESRSLQKLAGQLPGLERRLMRFTYLQAMHMAQIAACNRLHDVEERLARWLLMVQDRVHMDVFALTHEFLGNMLGSRRASVTIAAGILQKAGIIECSRGKIFIVDREKLEETACECYAIVRGEFDAYLKNEAPASPFFRPPA